MGNVKYPNKRFWVAGPRDQRIDYVTVRNSAEDDIKVTAVTCGCTAFYQELPTGYVLRRAICKCVKKVCVWLDSHGFEVAQLAADCEMVTPKIANLEPTKVEVEEKDEQLYTAVRILPL